MKRILLTAAILSTAAFGSSVTEKANLKFNFRTPAGDHAAGSYKLHINDGAGAYGLVELRNMDTNESVLFYPNTAIHAKHEGEKPRLIFKCVESTCNLAEIWTSSRGYAIRQRKPTPAEAERMAVTAPVTVSVAAAE